MKNLNTQEELRYIRSSKSLSDNLLEDKYSFFELLNNNQSIYNKPFFVVNNYGKPRSLFPFELNLYLHSLNFENNLDEEFSFLKEFELFKTYNPKLIKLPPDITSKEYAETLKNIKYTEDKSTGITELMSFWYRHRLTTSIVRDSLLYEIVVSLLDKNDHIKLLQQILLANEILDDLWLPYHPELWKTKSEKRYKSKQMLSVCKFCLKRFDSPIPEENLCFNKCKSNYINSINNWSEKLKSIFNSVNSILFANRLDNDESHRKLNIDLLLIDRKNLLKDKAKNKKKIQRINKALKLLKSKKGMSLIYRANFYIRDLGEDLSSYLQGIFQSIGLENIDEMFSSNNKVKPSIANQTYKKVKAILEKIFKLINAHGIGRETFLEVYNLFPILNEDTFIAIYEYLLKKHNCKIADKSEIKEVFSMYNSMLKVIKEPKGISYYERRNIHRLLQSI